MMHVGSVNGVVRSSSQSPLLEPINNNYELHGAALDVCRQIMTQTSWNTESYTHTVRLTQDAVDDDGGASFASMTLVPASTCYTVGGGSRY